MITVDEACRLLAAMDNAPADVADVAPWPLFYSEALQTVIDQAQQINDARTLIHELRDNYALLSGDALALLAILGEYE